MNRIQNVTRRAFLRYGLSGTALILGADFVPGLARAGLTPDSTVDRAAFHPNVFLGLNPDGTVIIVAHRSEMGNGSRTALPCVVADELDADWKRVKIVQAVGDPRYGSQATDASASIREFFELMREFGASARLMLIRAAAREWAVPLSECETGKHVVVHVPSGRQWTYGHLASAAAELPAPRKEDVQLKDRTAWRYIGKDASLYDLEDICVGKALYGMDATIDGMVYAAIERAPVIGGKVRSYQDSEALRVRGVRETILIPPFQPPHGLQPLGGVAVLADNSWAAFEGRKN